MKQRKFVKLECGHQKEIGHQKVGEQIGCAECQYALRTIVQVLPMEDKRPRWSDRMPV